MGSHVPLGYERDERTLRINEAEVETVRTLYTLYRKPETTPSFPDSNAPFRAASSTARK